MERQALPGLEHRARAGQQRGNVVQAVEPIRRLGGGPVGGTQALDGVHDAAVHHQPVRTQHRAKRAVAGVTGGLFRPACSARRIVRPGRCRVNLRSVSGVITGRGGASSPISCLHGQASVVRKMLYNIYFGASEPTTRVGCGIFCCALMDLLFGIPAGRGTGRAT
jgi:hypothetical protein